MARKGKKGKRIIAFALASLLLLQSTTVYGIEDSSRADEVVEVQDKAEKGDAGTDTTHPSDGSMAGEKLKFVNLYWETDDLGEIEAVFDGGEDKEEIKKLSKKKRGVYETKIPEGDYSRVSFRKADNEEPLEESTYNFYGEDVKDKETEKASFVPKKIIPSITIWVKILPIGEQIRSMITRKQLHLQRILAQI